jgi:protein O-mannosyl-transferase
VPHSNKIIFKNEKIMGNKKKYSKKNISDHGDHSKSLNNFTHPLVDEANKTIKIIICILLVLSTFAIYSQVQDHEFINYDDYQYIRDNWEIKSGLSSESISWAFTTFYGNNWFPITWLSHTLDYQLYGLNPKGHHLTSLFFHITNSLLLFLVLFRMTGALWKSAFVSVVFAIHPLNVESVAWVAERKNVLSTLFWLLTMWTYISYAQTKKLKTYYLVILFFTLGLMSKAMLVTLPFVLLLLDYWPLGRLKLEQGGSDKEVLARSKYHMKSEFLKLLLEKAPLFALTVGTCILTFIAQKSEAAMINLNNLSVFTRLTNAMVSYLEYLKKMIWPNELAVFYPHPESTLATWKWVVCSIVLVTITTISIRLIKKAPYFVVGWFWYLGTLIPVIGIVQVGGQAMADRYAYVPLIGIFIIVAWGLPDFLEKWPFKEQLLSISTVILIPMLMVITWTQVSLWKNSISVFKRAFRVSNEQSYNSYIINYHLGNAFFDKQKTGEAISHYKMAIELNPEFVNAYSNLGGALFVEGKNEDAISHFKTAIELKPDHADAHYNLGATLIAERKSEEAISHFKMAIKIKPDYIKAYNNLGAALVTQGRNEEAISHYKKAIQIKPDYALAHYNLGDALVIQGKNEEAISHFKIAIQIKPDYVDAHFNLGVVLFTAGRNEEAISHYKKAIQIKPDYAEAYNNLGNALFQKGAYKEAIDHYRETLKLKPNLVATQKNLEIAVRSMETQDLF